MSDNIQSLANQLAWCNTSRNYLTNLQAEIKHVGRRYYDDVESMRNDRYITELLPALDAVVSDFIQAADNVIRHVEERHISFIDDESKKIQIILNSL